MQVHEIPVVMPYRLDLTVSALRRLSTNVIDLLTPQGMYIRALSGFPEPVIVRVTQTPDRALLSVAVEGDSSHGAAVLRSVRGMLGADRDITHFYRAAARIAWLAPLVKRMRGVKPPRYPGIWEACVNAIVFQQLSLRAATAIMQRLIAALARPVKTDGDAEAAANHRAFLHPGMVGRRRVGRSADAPHPRSRQADARYAVFYSLADGDEGESSQRRMSSAKSVTVREPVA